MTNSFFHFRPFHVPWQNYAGDLAALLQTIGFTIAGFLGAIAIGLLVAVLRLAPWPPLRTIARIYTETFKNLPLVSEIFLVYFGLATIGIVLNVFVAGAISLAIFYGAYLSEIFRAGLSGRGPRAARGGPSARVRRSQAVHHTIGLAVCLPHRRGVRSRSVRH